MGEMAEMMLDGTLCECCGTYIDDEGGDGFPRYCSDQCARDRGVNVADEDPELPAPSHPRRTMRCPKCNKRVKVVGLDQHIRDVHEVRL